MREEAIKKIGHLYPQVDIKTGKPCTGAKGEQPATVIAWLWARTVKSPNPAFSDCDVPLVSTFILSSKKGKETWIKPVVEGKTYRFEVRTGNIPEKAIAGTKAEGRGANFVCILSNTPISGEWIKAEGKAGRMGASLLAVVAEGKGRRGYLSPTVEMEEVAIAAKPEWQPQGDVPARLTGGTCVPYGMDEWWKLFTPRQLVALTTFSDLVAEARNKVKADALAAGMLEGLPLAEGGDDARAYAEAVGVYLGFGVSKAVDRNTSLCFWEHPMNRLRGTFGRQALPMIWDYAETNPLAGSGGDVYGTVHSLCEVLDKFPIGSFGRALQADATTQSISDSKVVSTDPPYYDNISYADLSDFFYVWLRRPLRNIYPDLFATMTVPKAEELVATPYRHGSKEQAEQFFLDGMTEAMHRLSSLEHPAFPSTIYYAFKQSETKEGNISSTGWETFLAAVIEAGFSICGTWPMRTEMIAHLKKKQNALASSIILVCRKHPEDAATSTRKAFLDELQSILPQRLEDMIFGTGEKQAIHPADLAQAALGPGMAIYSRYAEVIRQDGSLVTVREALELINSEVSRFFNEGASDLDRDSRFCLAWSQMYGLKEGPFGEADTMARAKGTSVEGLTEAGVLVSGKGKVRLLSWSEFPSDWNPSKDKRIPAWELLHNRIRALNQKGFSAAGELLRAVPHHERPVRQLAYQLYVHTEQAGRAAEALEYNKLIAAWEDIRTAAASTDGEQIAMKLS